MREFRNTRNTRKSPKKLWGAGIFCIRTSFWDQVNYRKIIDDDVLTYPRSVDFCEPLFWRHLDFFVMCRRPVRVDVILLALFWRGASGSSSCWRCWLSSRRRQSTRCCCCWWAATTAQRWSRRPGSSPSSLSPGHILSTANCKNGKGKNNWQDFHFYILQHIWRTHEKVGNSLTRRCRCPPANGLEKREWII